MNEIQKFFRKYNAVAATDHSPDWKSASDDVLIAWLNGTPAGSARQEIAREVGRRYVNQLPNVSDAIKRAWLDYISK